MIKKRKWQCPHAAAGYHPSILPGSTTTTTGEPSRDFISHFAVRKRSDFYGSTGFHGDETVNRHFRSDFGGILDVSEGISGLWLPVGGRTIER